MMGFTERPLESRKSYIVWMSRLSQSQFLIIVFDTPKVVNETMGNGSGSGSILHYPIWYRCLCSPILLVSFFISFYFFLEEPETKNFRTSNYMQSTTLINLSLVVLFFIFANLAWMDNFLKKKRTWGMLYGIWQMSMVS